MPEGLPGGTVILLRIAICAERPGVSTNRAASRVLSQTRNPQAQECRAGVVWPLLAVQIDGLVEAGNTVTVVEHDRRVIAGSDWVIDTGPGAGEEGGRIVAAGNAGRGSECATERNRAVSAAFPHQRLIASTKGLTRRAAIRIIARPRHRLCLGPVRV
jgi:hypothetical protein